MKAEDLRIGNYVRVSSDNCMFPKGALCEVVAIDSERTHEEKKGLADLLQIVREEWEFSHGVWCDDIEGIPINSEFLRKNGFENVRHHIDEDGFEWCQYEHEDSCLEIWHYLQYDAYSAFYCAYELCKISFVHEIQNIIAATKDSIKIIV